MRAHHAASVRTWSRAPGHAIFLVSTPRTLASASQTVPTGLTGNRQDTKDRLRGELDYDENRRAASEIQGLARKLNALHDKIVDVDDLIRQRFNKEDQLSS